MSDWKSEYQVVYLDEILRQFIRGFRPKGGMELYEPGCNYFVDTAKGKVVFELMLKPKDPPPSQMHSEKEKP